MSYCEIHMSSQNSEFFLIFVSWAKTLERVRYSQSIKLIMNATMSHTKKIFVKNFCFYFTASIQDVMKNQTEQGQEERVIRLIIYFLHYGCFCSYGWLDQKLAFYAAWKSEENQLCQSYSFIQNSTFSLNIRIVFQTFL